MADDRNPVAENGPLSMAAVDRVARRLNARDLTVRPMDADDRSAVLAFADGLPDHDLLFLRRDIREADVVDQWIGEIESGQMTTLLALADAKLIGYASIDRSQLQWSSHGIEKVVARMTPDQKGAVAAFEGLGFRPEGLMRNHVRDLSGEKHDLLVMGLDIVALHGTLEGYGLDEAVAAAGD
ncbi:MAG: GNAT family protein [Acidobacteriota bacterium]|nr:GNAT family protein [Acidobacteriota bacterium]